MTGGPYRYMFLSKITKIQPFHKIFFAKIYDKPTPSYQKSLNRIKRNFVRFCVIYSCSTDLCWWWLRTVEYIFCVICSCSTELCWWWLRTVVYIFCVILYSKIYRTTYIESYLKERAANLGHTGTMLVLAEVIHLDS